MTGCELRQYGGFGGVGSAEGRVLVEVLNRAEHSVAQPSEETRRGVVWCVVRVGCAHARDLRPLTSALSLRQRVRPRSTQNG